jgi:hypothetical protein
MVIIHDLKTIFIHVQRTGGSSVTKLFHRFYQYRMNIVSQHGNYLSEDARFIHKYSDYFIFGFVRNPWDRMLSWYSLIHQEDALTFDEERVRFEHFLKEFSAKIKNDNTFHWNQIDYFPNQQEVDNPVQICRFENYQTEVKSVFKKLGMSIDTIPSMNGTQKKEYQQFYTDKSKQIIQENCKKDIEYFQYHF